MDKDRFEIFCKLIEQAFIKITSEMLNMNFVPTSDTINSLKRFIVIIGAIGKDDKGRIILELPENTALKISEIMNDEPVDKLIDISLYLGEFTNIVCGNAVTLLNNQFPGQEIRLTPAAVFSGQNVELLTPNIQSKLINYKFNDYLIRLDIGFEGIK